MNLHSLRVLNFRDILRIKCNDVSTYNFEEYRNAGGRHPVEGFCTRCEEQNTHISPTDSQFRLQLMSHGAHASDFLLSLKAPPDTSEWHHDPVMFVYESPGGDSDFFHGGLEYKSFTKRPTLEWYWIHRENELVSFPGYFSGGVYGDFVLSAIQSFRLANVYMTNLVKCGMNDQEGNYRGLADYNPSCINTCMQQFLAQEIEIMQPKVIFAVGTAVYNRLLDFLPENHFVQQLPHPAGRRRGFRDEHFKVLYFWLVVRALHKSGIIAVDEARDLAQQFLTRFDD